MSLSLPIAFAAVALLPLTAMAQELGRRDPAHADAKVPAVVYRSLFSDYQPLQEGPVSPDQVWSAANQQAGDLGGHAGQIRSADRPASSLPARAGTEVPTQRRDKHHHHH